MSAFMCNDAAFDLITSAAVACDASLWIDEGEALLGDWRHDPPSYGGYRLKAKGNEQALWACLRAANIHSVQCRYPGDTDMVGEPGPGKYRPVIFGHYMGATAVAAAKAVQSFMYQSCESPDWEGSMAKRWCDYLLSALWRKVAGYEDAAWSPTDRDVRPTRAQERELLAERTANHAHREHMATVNVD